MKEHPRLRRFLPAERSSRRAWLVSGLALIAAAVTGAAATHLWWLPCQGRMLVGTPYGPRFSDSLLGEACIDRMNEGTPFPLPTEAVMSAPGLLALSTITPALVAVAWLVPVWECPASRVVRFAVALPGLSALVVALLGIGIGYGLPGAEGLAYPLATVNNLWILVVLCVLLASVREQRVRFVVAALALSSMGFFGPVAEYLLMIRWSDANWDAPPGSGYLTAAYLLICGLLIVIMTVFSRHRPAPVRTFELEDVTA